MKIERKNAELKKDEKGNFFIDFSSLMSDAENLFEDKTEEQKKSED